MKEAMRVKLFVEKASPGTDTLEAQCNKFLESVNSVESIQLSTVAVSVVGTELITSILVLYT